MASTLRGRLVTLAATGIMAAGVWTQLLRLRLRALRRAGQWWYILTTLYAMMLNYIVAKVCALVLPVELRKRVLCCVCHWVLRATIVANPQIRVRGDIDWSALPPRAMILMPHTSWIDTVMFSAWFPARFIQHARGLFKSTLLGLPLGGEVFRLCGHFPVYFQKDEEGAWAVDQKRQEPVNDRVNNFLSGDRAYLGLFPEGAVNKTPAALRSFRRGSFDLAMRHQLPVWAFVMAGCDDCWAPGGTPGADSDIDVSLIEVAQDPSAFSGKAALADHCHATMQAEVHRLLMGQVARGGPAGASAAAKLHATGTGTD